MDTSVHTLGTLFEQLGLESDEASIRRFIDSHSLQPSTMLAEAPFWNHAQSEFIREGLLEDSDWAELIDLLDALLRK